MTDEARMRYRIRFAKTLKTPGGSTMTPKEVLEFAKKNKAKQLDLRFSDIPGLQHHVSYPITELGEDSFTRRLRHGRLQHPRLGGHQRERHAADPGRRDGVHGSVLSRSRRW